MAPSEPSIGIAEDDLGAEARAMSLRALADVGRHDEAHGDAERRAEERVGDAGVAARRVDERLVAA